MVVNIVVMTMNCEIARWGLAPIVDLPVVERVTAATRNRIGEQP